MKDYIEQMVAEDIVPAEMIIKAQGKHQERTVLVARIVGEDYAERPAEITDRGVELNQLLVVEMKSPHEGISINKNNKHGNDKGREKIKSPWGMAGRFDAGVRMF